MDTLSLAFQVLGQLKSRGHSAHSVGTMHIITSPLAGRDGFYLTAVMQNSVPFDAQISDGMEGAVTAHTSFVVAADMYENSVTMQPRGYVELN